MKKPLVIHKFIIILFLLSIATPCYSTSRMGDFIDDRLNHIDVSKTFLLVEDGDEQITFKFKYEKNEIIWAGISVLGNWDTVDFWKKVSKSLSGGEACQILW